MARNGSSLLSKLYWPVVGFFALALAVYVIAFVTTIERSASGGYYDARGLKTIAFLIAMLVGSIALKRRGNTKAAHWIVFAPLGLVLLTVVLFFAMASSFGNGA